MGQGLFLNFFDFFGEAGNFVLFCGWRDFLKGFFFALLWIVCLEFNPQSNWIAIILEAFFFVFLCGDGWADCCLLFLVLGKRLTFLVFQAF